MRPWPSTARTRAGALLAGLCAFAAPGCSKPAPIGTWHGLQGDIEIDRFGDARLRHIITTVRDGQMANLD